MQKADVRVEPPAPSIHTQWSASGATQRVINEQKTWKHQQHVRLDGFVVTQHQTVDHDADFGRKVEEVL